MKKIVYIIVTLCVIFSLSDCSTTSKRNSSIPAKFPASVKKAIKNAPSDALIGVGVANNFNTDLSMSVSSARAHAEISRQLNLIVNEFVVVKNENDQRIKEKIIVTISSSEITNSKIHFRTQVKDGSFWTVVILEKENAVKHLDPAKDNTISANSSMTSIEINNRLNAVYRNAIKKKLKANGM